jgi:hypothetical protein
MKSKQSKSNQREVLPHGPLRGVGLHFIITCLRKPRSSSSTVEFFLEFPGFGQKNSRKPKGLFWR